MVSIAGPRFVSLEHRYIQHRYDRIVSPTAHKTIPAKRFLRQILRIRTPLATVAMSSIR
jgi:hypothetical protein